ncbi:hypothetical protein MKY64_30395 [Paenibacillus sp. FSL R7-0210]|uniref:hypothetical protein n=1 Tax=Paenibacillus sp. FSL R7-0210 TaxID=2921676 RepID=UPI0030F837C9
MASVFMQESMLKSMVKYCLELNEQGVYEVDVILSQMIELLTAYLEIEENERLRNLLNRYLEQQTEEEQMIKVSIANMSGIIAMYLDKKGLI